MFLFVSVNDGVHVPVNGGVHAPCHRLCRCNGSCSCSIVTLHVLQYMRLIVVALALHLL